MNTKFKIGFAVAAALLIFSSFTSKTNPEEPQKKEVKKHLKMIKIEDGVKTEIDTVVTGDSDFTWMTDEFPMEGMDSIMHAKLKKYHIQINEDGDVKHKNFVFAGPDDFEWVMHDAEKMGMDSVKHIIRLKHGDGEEMDHFIFKGDHLMVPPHPPVPPRPFVKVFHGGNVIDLDDPGIISYKKKDLSNGREKIEIIREKRDKNIEVDEDIIIETPEK